MPYPSPLSSRLVACFVSVLPDRLIMYFPVASVVGLLLGLFCTVSCVTTPFDSTCSGVFVGCASGRLVGVCGYFVVRVLRWWVVEMCELVMGVLVALGVGVEVGLFGGRFAWSWAVGGLCVSGSVGRWPVVEQYGLFVWLCIPGIWCVLVLGGGWGVIVVLHVLSGRLCVGGLVALLGVLPLVGIRDGASSVCGPPVWLWVPSASCVGFACCPVCSLCFCLLCFRLLLCFSVGMVLL